MQVINSDKKFNIWFRAVIFLVICFFTYAMAMYYMLSQHNILTSLLFVLVFFIFAHFAYLHFMWLKNRHLVLILLLLISLNLLIFWYQWIFMTLFNVAFHTWIFMLIWYIDGSSRNVIVFDSWSYFTSSGYMFTVFVTISSSFALLWLYQKFPFTCQQLSDTSSKVIDFVAYPLRMSLNQADKVKIQTKNLFAMKVWDFFVNSELVSGPVFINKKEQLKFMDKIVLYKQKYLDETMKENDNLNMGVCDYLLKRVESVYQNTTLQISIVVTLFLLLYGFIRITFWVMTIIWFVIFKLLCLLKVYSFEKITVEADKIV